MPTKKTPPPIYRLKITLVGIEPPIWRVVQVQASIRLCCLHDALQAVMGWTDSHLHQFEKDGKNWGVPEYDEFDELDLIDESKTPVGKVLKAEGDSMTYVYDFGDDWRHEVVLEKVIPVNDVVKTPICFGGERRCPPEDVGGVRGYQEFLEVIFDPSHEEYDHLVGWAGGPFHAEEFDLKAVNEILSRMRWPIRHRR
ncbi:MAG: plasmid pRiA4b ORF-3 family protein [Bryobacterales bacterium]|nr:plasmid pRiA4b ORF-3 family protein [Bryobacterales bacterium]